MKRFALLLVPGELDLTQPVRVVVDGEPVVERTLEPDLRTLLRWAARDDNRTALFPVERTVAVE